MSDQWIKDCLPLLFLRFTFEFLFRSRTVVLTMSCVAAWPKIHQARFAAIATPIMKMTDCI